MRPSVLILDEPTAGLDPTAHREILSMIRRINDNREIIIIFVSHNMDDIANMCSRVVVMDKGKVSLEGTPQEVFAQGRLLESMGLDVPPVVHIMNKISDEVSGFYSSALTIDEAAKDIREYIKRKK